MTAEHPGFALQSGLDIGTARTAFEGAGRVQLENLLEPHAPDSLYDCLRMEVPWQLHFNDGAQSHDVDLAQFQALGEASQQALIEAIHQNAARDFQYLFDNFPVADAYDAGEHADLLLMQFHEFVNTEEFLDLARQVTGIESIRMADSQATRYRPGHFLTTHDDEADGKHRMAAYVLSLTPDWRADFGGLLNFVDRGGNVTGTYTPGFNVLHLFQVPQAHAVSCVAPFAPAPRYSLSGWLRAA